MYWFNTFNTCHRHLFSPYFIEIIHFVEKYLADCVKHVLNTIEKYLREFLERFSLWDSLRAVFPDYPCTAWRMCRLCSSENLLNPCERVGGLERCSWLENIFEPCIFLWKTQLEMSIPVTSSCGNVTEQSCFSHIFAYFLLVMSFPCVMGTRLNSWTM